VTAPTDAPRRVPGRHLVLVGCTASGKSALALALARRRRAGGRAVEIISCDSMAVYRGMDIGTATPGAAERDEVPHHLVDVVDPDEEFSVQRFAAAVDAALDGIEARGADAVLVGGTGLYVRAVTDGLDLPPRYPEVAARLEAEPDTGALERRLAELDPLAASRIPPGNRRRLVRALEVTIGSGRPFSSSGPGLGAYAPTPFVMVGLRVPRDVIAARIRDRYDEQLAEGFVDEVRALSARPGGVSRTAAEALGYRELLAHLRGECSLDDAVATAVARTRRFAVRQERWFRRDPRIRFFDVPDPSDPSDPSRTAVAADVDAYWAECAAAGVGSATTVEPDGWAADRTV
jgi:tRNA dimethylallyltransferase